jgi:kynureninase
MPGADGWQLSNKNILSMAAQHASLDLFQQTDMQSLRKKSLLLTGFLEFLIREQLNKEINIITPEDPLQRGCQLSLMVKNGKEVFQALTQNDVIADWREPDVIRVAPVPFYNTFEEVYTFVDIIKSVLKNQTV